MSRSYDWLWHRYTTDTSYKEWEQMRISLEPLTYQYGVDVSFYGETFSLSRSCCTPWKGLQAQISHLKASRWRHMVVQMLQEVGTM